MPATYFRQFGILTEQEIEEVQSLCLPKELCRNEYFVRAGEPCREIAYVQSGLFRSFYPDETGADTTFCFRFQGEMIASYSSFITGLPGNEAIQALTPARLQVISREAIYRLADKSMSWVRVLKTIAEYEYVELEKRVVQLQKNNASQRYQELMQTQPTYIKDIPLQYLASYLGISQRHLSRIRKERI